MSISKMINLKMTKMKKDLHTPSQERTRLSSSSSSASKPLPSGNGRLCGKVVTPRVQSGRTRKPSVTKIREQYRRSKVEDQVLEADGTIMSVAEEDEATSGYHYPDYSDSEESDSSMPPLMDIAELGSKRKTPTSLYSNFEVGKDDDWKYTIPETNSGSPPPRSPPSTYQPSSQPTYQPTYQPPSQPTYQPTHQTTHSYQPPFSYLSQEFPRDFWEPVLPTPRTHHQPTSGREDQRLEQEELEELPKLERAQE